ncbi:F-box/LRR-repeat protein 4-like [Aphidius gifuensis]|uniref:F-box/LRR-repeat protein 4-like n=1 Tax=Aphidius gifuensis TaxID=684658 RepID=UPI001CDD0BD3|nr:F-box/LRR-repeat protein 4-like [Aphidius gifuensis]
MINAEEISHADKKQLFDDVDQKIDVIEFLDDYSLAEIFMLLPIPDRMAMEKVCLKWEEACKLAWYKTKKYKCGRTIGRAYNDQLLTQSYVEKLLLQCGIHLNELCLSKICTSSIMPVIGEYCKYLTRLEFVLNQRSKVNTDDYIQAFKKLDKLKYIKIKATPLENHMIPNLNYEIFDSLPEEINEIHLYHPKVTTDTIPLFFNLKKYKSLHSLTLSGCTLDNIIQQISEQIPLVYLDLDNSVNYDNDNNDNTDNSNIRVPSASIFDELSKLEYLEYLNIACVENFQDSSLIAIAKECTNLEFLNISNCRYITEAGLDAIIGIKSLRRLNVRALKCVTDSFVGKLKGLNSLECGRCTKVTDVGIIQFIENCPDLKHLYVGYTCMTIDTIIAANQATKYRENNIVLHIHGCHEELKAVCRSIIESKWLVTSYMIKL